MLRFHNTLTGKKEEFIPIEQGKVRMYTCGPTVYDYAHIGNYRAYIFEDILRRYLKFKGYEVIQVMNLTDVDDKTIKGSRTAGISLGDYTEKYRKAFFEDIKTLNIEPAEYYPAATDHIQEMIELIKRIMDAGYAYKSEDGSVYFSIAKFANYGQLAKIDISGLRPGARVSHDEYEKENLADFALWKAWDKDDGDVYWDSPWGRGRPGWHIECSAMSMKYLGETFDIHTGGVDNIFPHHEDEIAQSEAATGRKFVNYWMHCQHLVVDGAKMSKSLGNFFTIREVLEKFSPETIRLWMLSTHYRSPLDYSDARLEESASALKRFYNTFSDVEELQGRGKTEPASGPFVAEKHQHLSELPKRIERLTQGFEEAMDDDFNTAAALGTLFDMLKAINSSVRLVADQQVPATMLQPLQEAVKTVKALARILGFGFSEKALLAETDQLLVDQLVGFILELRQEARAEKNWAVADRIRDGLAQIGIQVKDRPGGESTWKLEK